MVSALATVACTVEMLFVFIQCLLASYQSQHQAVKYYATAVIYHVLFTPWLSTTMVYHVLHSMVYQLS